LANLRKKHNDAVAEMAEQVDQLNKLKTKWVLTFLDINFTLQEHKFYFGNLKQKIHEIVSEKIAEKNI
jgi:hypothetical protein